MKTKSTTNKETTGLENLLKRNSRWPLTMHVFLPISTPTRRPAFRRVDGIAAHGMVNGAGAHHIGNCIGRLLNPADTAERKQSQTPSVQHASSPTPYLLCHQSISGRTPFPQSPGATAPVACLSTFSLGLVWCQHHQWMFLIMEVQTGCAFIVVSGFFKAG